MAKTCSRCSAELSMRNHHFYQGKDLCRDCLRIIEAEEASAQQAVSSSSVGSGSPVVARYRDAYRIGAALVGLGNAIKVAGAVLGGIIALGSLASAGGQFGGAGVVLGGVFVALVIGVLFWACGVMVSAQGQILQATLDNAVANSPFLTNQERAVAMGLPLGVAKEAAIT